MSSVWTYPWAGHMLGKKTTPVMPRVLRALFESTEALTKYEIKKRTGVGRQPLINNIKLAKSFGWVEGVPMKSRVGTEVESYKLTIKGGRRLAIMDPDLAPKIKTGFGHAYEELEKRGKEHYFAKFKQYLTTAQNIIERGTAPPNWHMVIKIESDKNGRVHGYRVSIGPRWIRRRRRRSQQASM